MAGPRDLHGGGVEEELFLELPDDAPRVRTHAVHLVDERHARDLRRRARPGVSEPRGEGQGGWQEEREEEDEDEDEDEDEETL